MSENENTEENTTGLVSLKDKMAEAIETVKEVQKVDETPNAADELDALKKRADIIGLKYHPKIGLSKLKERVNAQLSKDAAQLAKDKKVALEAVDDIPNVPQTTLYDQTPKTSPKHETPVERKMRMHRQASRLVRIRMTCMNPAKKAWPGEMFTVSNSSAGTFKKYIPFNIDNGWHIPQIMLGMLQERKFVEHYTAGKDSRGRPIKRHRLIREFAIEEMPPLTASEIEDLKTQQALAGTIGKE